MRQDCRHAIIGRLRVLPFGCLQQFNATDRCNLRDIELSRLTFVLKSHVCCGQSTGILCQATALESRRLILPCITLHLLLAFATSDRNQCYSTHAMALLLGLLALSCLAYVSIVSRCDNQP
jgi:hypothetical protein